MFNQAAYSCVIWDTLLPSSNFSRHLNPWDLYYICRVSFVYVKLKLVYLLALIKLPELTPFDLQFLYEIPSITWFEFFFLIKCLNLDWSLKTVYISDRWLMHSKNDYKYMYLNIFKVKLNERKNMLLDNATRVIPLWMCYFFFFASYLPVTCQQSKRSIKL